MAASNLHQELRVVMVGKTGIGKSSLGNSLLQQKCFIAKQSGESVTKSCKVGHEKHNEDSNLMIIDTPGVFDTATPNEETLKEISKCVGLASPGPHIFIFVLSVTRFTSEELNTIEHLKETFGDAVIDYTIVVFTGKDQLGNDDDDDDDGDGGRIHNITEYVENSPQCLRDFVTDQCKGRFTAICNRTKHPGHLEDVHNVIDLIRKTTRNNKDTFYTEIMFEAAEKAIQEELKLRSSHGNPASRENIRDDIASEKGNFWKRFVTLVKKILGMFKKK